jgi:Reticulon
VFHWRDPVESGLVFVIVCFFYCLLSFGEYSVITLVSYLLLTGLLVSGLYVNGTLLYASIQKKKAVHPFRYVEHALIVCIYMYVYVCVCVCAFAPRFQRGRQVALV